MEEIIEIQDHVMGNLSSPLWIAKLLGNGKYLSANFSVCIRAAMAEYFLISN
jgi:hypothetical protein